VHDANPKYFTTLVMQGYTKFANSLTAEAQNAQNLETVQIPLSEEEVENLQIRLESQVIKLYDSINVEETVMDDHEIENEVTCTLDKDNNEVYARTTCRYCGFEKLLTCRRRHGKISYIDVINLKRHLIKDHNGILWDLQGQNNSGNSNRQTISQNDNEDGEYIEPNNIRHFSNIGQNVDNSSHRQNLSQNDDISISSNRRNLTPIDDISISSNRENSRSQQGRRLANEPGSSSQRVPRSLQSK